MSSGKETVCHLIKNVIGIKQGSRKPHASFPELAEANSNESLQSLLGALDDMTRSMLLQAEAQALAESDRIFAGRIAYVRGRFRGSDLQAELYVIKQEQKAESRRLKRLYRQDVRQRQALLRKSIYQQAARPICQRRKTANHPDPK